MKSPINNKTILFLFAVLIFPYELFCERPANSGFHLPESIEEVTIHYTNMNNLIVLPVVINGNLSVNLMLDTGTRNIVLFGKRFKHLFEFIPDKKIQFSGMGSGSAVFGKLSLDNQVELTSLIGEKIPIVVVTNKNIFDKHPKIDGVIGYDIFQKFEVEINSKQNLITFRSPSKGFVPHGFIQIPMRVEKTIPVVDSRILFENGSDFATGLMIDTGSQLGLLIKTTKDELISSGRPGFLGHGMSGDIEGIKTFAQQIHLTGIDFSNKPAGIIPSEWHDYGSIGMGILKDYVLIINYIGGYACLKKS